MENKNCDQGRTYDNIEDSEYYSALQDSLQSYDAKLWLMPGLFFGIVVLLVQQLQLNKGEFLLSQKNGLTFILGFFLIGLLLLYYNKAHLFSLLIQKKINEFDSSFNKMSLDKIERVPLASMPEKELKQKLSKLVADDKLEISPVQYFLAEFRVSSFMRNIMLVSCAICLFLGLTIWIKIIFKV